MPTINQLINKGRQSKIARNKQRQEVVDRYAAKRLELLRAQRTPVPTFTVSGLFNSPDDFTAAPAASVNVGLPLCSRNQGEIAASIATTGTTCTATTATTCIATTTSAACIATTSSACIGL